MGAIYYVGDAISVMSTLPEKSVDLVLTSPPFLALRSYLPADHPDKKLEGGSQATPGAYIDWLIDVVEACDRVLAPHGSLCIELGDTYAGSGGAGGDYAENGLREGQPVFEGSNKRQGNHRNDKVEMAERGIIGTTSGERMRANRPAWPLAKSLSLIPELFRLTLVYGTNPLTGRSTERWRLRNVIRWVRPNPPVGALGDKFRPATSELMVFCKSAKRFFDLDAVREPHAPHALKYYTDDAPYLKRLQADETRHAAKGKTPGRADGGFMQSAGINPAGAPPLDWWNIPPGGYEGAHYAVWPPELLIKPIKAMCPERVCRVCGEPSRRIVEEVTPRLVDAGRFGKDRDQGRHVGGPFTTRTSYTPAVRETERFSDCGHNDWRHGLVLDPFVGSGTTLAVANGHGRDAVGIDLDERNYDLALGRVGPLILQRGETTV